MHRSLRRILSGVVALALLVGLVLVLGPDAVAGELARTHLPTFALGLVSVLGALALWAESQRVLFVASDIPLSRVDSGLAYGAGMFAKQVIPMGHAAGPAVMAYVVTRVTGREYGETLAPVSAGEFLSLVASFALAVVGLGYVVVSVPPSNLVSTVQVAVAVVVAVLVGLLVLYRYRPRTVVLAVRAVALAAGRLLGRLWPGRGERFAPDRIHGATERFFGSLRTLSDDRRRVLVALTWLTAGWVAFAAPLYTSALALGVEIPFLLVLFVVPAVGLVTFVPLPGGIGGTEIATTAVLVATAGLSPTVAASVTLLYRLCAYWFVVLVGGVVSWVVSVRPRAATTVPAEAPTPLTDADGGGERER